MGVWALVGHSEDVKAVEVGCCAQKIALEISVWAIESRYSQTLALDCWGTKRSKLTVWQASGLTLEARK